MPGQAPKIGNGNDPLNIELVITSIFLYISHMCSPSVHYNFRTAMSSESKKYIYLSRRSVEKNACKNLGQIAHELSHHEK